MFLEQHIYAYLFFSLWKECAWIIGTYILVSFVLLQYQFAFLYIYNSIFITLNLYIWSYECMHAMFTITKKLSNFSWGKMVNRWANINYAPNKRKHPITFNFPSISHFNTFWTWNRDPGGTEVLLYWMFNQNRDSQLRFKKRK